MMTWLLIGLGYALPWLLPIAGLIVFLASDEASFVSGQSLAVDGGFSLG